jgi:hypothetical protein
MLAEKLGHDLKPRFGIEVSPDLPMQPDRGARIDKVGDLHDMLALARWISGNRARIFEIELDLLPWLPARERLGLAATVLLDAASAAQDLPNRRLGAGQADAGVFEGRITMDIVEDRFWPGDTALGSQAELRGSPGYVGRPPEASRSKLVVCDVRASGNAAP